MSSSLRLSAGLRPKPSEHATCDVDAQAEPNVNPPISDPIETPTRRSLPPADAAAVLDGRNSRLRHFTTPAVWLAATILCTAIPVTRAAVCDGVHVVGNTSLNSVVVVSGLASRPLFVTAPVNDIDRLFVVGQTGLIHIHKRGDDPAVNTVFLNISSKTNASSCSECGLLGLAFDPSYATNRRFYVYYTEQATGGMFTVVARYTVSTGNPDLADATSEMRLVRFLQPESNHNGGWIAFGADGYLYISTGDGGGSNDQHGTCGNGQPTTTLLGKILRVDPASLPANRNADCGGTTNYRVPADNPLAGSPVSNCEEIYAWGLRNPWRPSIDSLTGDWYIADVGQNCWEEVNWVAAANAKGRNYGWREMEGNHCFNPNQPSNCTTAPPSSGCPKTCNDPAFTRPVLEYSHSSGCSITGGFVYRGCQMSGFQGTYFYGDYCDGWVRSLKMAAGVATAQTDWTSTIDPLGSLESGLTSFGSDAQGELYITDRDGEVRRISPPFTDLEVSGDGVPNAQQFKLRPTSWTWEDLKRSTMNPVSQYRIYRSSTSNGTYTCIFKTTATSWTGDTAKPAIGSAYYYLILAANAAGELTRSSKLPRALSPTICP
jgi:glucose/arabinose dehydrogenase